MFTGVAIGVLVLMVLAAAVLFLYFDEKQ